MEEILILCHGDCDGLTSGAIALAANPGAQIWLTNPIRLDNELKQIKKKFDRIIIIDIALNENDYRETFLEMVRLQKLGTEIIYIDHHPLPEELNKREIPSTIVLHRMDGCSSELTYLHFQNKLTWQHRILAAIGAVGDYDMGTIFTQEVLRDYDARSIAFQAAIIVQALGEIPTDDDIKLKKSIIERLALGVLPSEINILVEKAIQGSIVEKYVREFVYEHAQKRNNIGYIIDIPTGGGFIGKGALFAATAMDKPVGVCGNIIDEKISISIRRRMTNIDLNVAARKAAKDVGGSGGGHPSAAGASIGKVKLNRFLELLDIEIQKQLK